MARNLLTLRLAVFLLTQPFVYAFSVFLSMWTQGQVHVLMAGQSIDLDCEFYAEEFSMFNNPVIWKKFQRQEQVEVNIMGNILPPFFDTGRFRVALTTNPPRYRLQLKITDLSLEDSGNYTCEVRGPKSSIMASVTHYIFIRAPVQEIYFVKENATTEEKHIPYSSHLHHASFQENAMGRLRCASVGGYPPPEMSVFIGERDVTPLFTQSTAATLHGTRGLRLMVHQTVFWTDRLTVSAADDGKTARCVATVSGLAANTTHIRITVNYGPIVRCRTAAAHIGDKNVRLTCEVRARPGLTSLFWIIDVNGTAITEGVVIDEYWSLNMDRSDGVMESSLFMRQATTASFRTYTLHAENNVAVTTARVTLVQNRSPSSTTMLPLVGRHKSQRDRAAPYNPHYTILTAAVNHASSAAVTAAPTSSMLPLLLLFIAASLTSPLSTST